MKHNFYKTSYNNNVELFLEGEDYFSFYLELIENAQETIHLQTYIFLKDSFGARVQAALIKAANRGVKVYLLIDSIGSKDFSAEDEAEFKLPNIYFCRFNGMNYKSFYHWGRRLHHKIILIDHQKSIVGGINVTTSGYGNDHFRQQLDFAVYLEGPVIAELIQYCQFVFKNACKNSTSINTMTLALNSKKKIKNGFEVKVSINDWVYRRWQITRQYSRLTQIAKSDITIINSYFFPRKKFMKQLVAAAKRGVKVRLILPRLSDWPSYILASQYLYSYFLKNNVEIYEWKKSILHGKLATVDGYFSSIGSFNLNYTSYQQNLEINIDVFSEIFTENLNARIDEIIDQGCEKIEPDQFFTKTSFKIKFFRFVFYIILSMIANLSIGLSYQEENKPENENKYYSLVRIIGAIIFFILGLVGILLPVIPGLPFFVISFLLVYRQLLYNKKLKF